MDIVIRIIKGKVIIKTLIPFCKGSFKVTNALSVTLSLIFFSLSIKWFWAAVLVIYLVSNLVDKILV